MSEMKQDDELFISPNKSTIPGQALGEFYPHNKSGAACYVFDIAVPPGVRGIEPSFSLYYNSLQEDADRRLGRGWTLVGLPTIQRKGPSTYLQNGKKISLIRDGKGAFYSFDLDGTKTTYCPDHGKNKAVLKVTEISDFFGNKLLVNYGDNGTIVSVEYGTKFNQNRIVNFSYDKRSGLLTNIETRVESKWVHNYKIEHQNGTVRSITLIANDQNNLGRVVAREPTCFDYNETNGLPDHLSFITEASGLEIKLNYSEVAGVLSAYHRIIKRPFQKKSIYSYKIEGRNMAIDIMGDPYFEKLSFWDESEQTGKYWHYANKGKQAGLLLVEGNFGGCLAEVEEGEATYPFTDPNSEKIAHHYKTSESLFEYVWHKKTNEFLRCEKSSRLYLEPGKHLPVTTKNFEHDEDGQLIRQIDTTKTATREYIKGPGPGNPRFLSRSSLYDTSKSKKLGSSNLLKDDKFDHKFDAKTGHIVSISHSVMIGAGVYSNPEISELDSMGHPLRLTSANGMVTQTSYDKNHFAAKETRSSKDGKKVVAQKTIREPAFGNIVYSKSFEGAITHQQQDPFGQLTSVYGFDPSAPSTWERDEGLTLRNSTETYHCPKFDSIITREKRFAQGDKGLLETRTVLDALFRPVIVMTEIGPKKWSISFTLYGSQDREKAVSLPIEVISTKDALAKTIRSIKRNKVFWVEKIWDAFGREAGVQNADGSGQRIVYSLSDKGEICVARVAINAQGEFGNCTQEVMDENGSVKSTHQGDSEPTEYTHDVLGQVVQKKDPSGQITRYEWNSMGQCILEDSPVTGLRSRKIDKSLLMVEENTNGTVISYTYDWQGRLVQKAYKAKGREARTYGLKYEASSQNRSTSLTATHPDGWATTLEFAPTGEELSREVRFGPSYTEIIKTDLHADGSVKARHFPDGKSLEFKYSGAGWITQIGWQNGSLPLVSFSDHDLNGRPRETRFANGVTERRVISDTGNMTHFSVMKEGAANKASYINQKFTHLPGHMGLLDTVDFSGKSELTRREEYHYDALGRLDYVGGGEKSSGEYFRHGPAGNLSDFKRQDGLPTARITDGLNHNVEIANENGIDWTFEFGDEGQCKSARGGDQMWEYIFGPDNSLEKLVGKRSGVSVESNSVSDAYGDRLVKADSTGDTTLYVAPDFQITRKADGETLSTILLLSENGCVGEMTKAYSGNTKRSLLFKEFKTGSQKNVSPLGENLNVTGRAPGDVFLHLDQRGSTILATNEKGTELASLKFDAYGKIDEINSSGTCSFTPSFAGMQIDTLTGLYFAGARYYSPEFLCFLSPDPNRSSTDSYAYPSDPINYFDFDGRCGWRDWCRSFSQNLGRKATTVGQGVFAMAGGFLLYFAWDQAAFGYDEGLASRWGLAIGLWFFQLATLSKSIGFCYNERRRLCCQSYCGNSRITTFASDLLRITCGAAIGTVWLGPLLSFIGNEDCSGWEMFNCAPEFYRMNAIRGCFPSIVAGIFAVGFRRLLERCSCSSNTLLSQYLVGVVNAWVGFSGWQGTDTLILYFGYGRTFSEIVAGKASFVTGEMLFAFFLSQPNPFWGLLPALLNSSCLNQRVWNRLFEAPGVFPVDHARAGARIQWFGPGVPPALSPAGDAAVAVGPGTAAIALGPIPPAGGLTIVEIGEDDGSVLEFMEEGRISISNVAPEVQPVGAISAADGESDDES